MKRTNFNLMTDGAATKRALLAIVFCISASVAAAAQGAARPAPPQPPADPHAGHRMGDAQPSGEAQSPAQKYFTDVELVDQDGKTHRLYTDLLKGKTVVANAFFTTCTSVCPPMTANLRKLQDALGDRVGRDVLFVSISVDPETDTPARLKEYAEKFHAKPGWLFLTGKKENVEWALYKLGQYVEDKNDHTTVVIVGKEATGLWKKAFALAPSAQLLEIVQSVADDKGETAKQD
jgi:protein SCO1